MNDRKLKGIAVILFGILLSASGAEMNRTVLASFSDFPFALIGIIVGIVGLIMVFKNNKGSQTKKLFGITAEELLKKHGKMLTYQLKNNYFVWNICMAP